MQKLVLEVRRKGRRPRYHEGARTYAGVLVKPEQCNTDQADEVVELPSLPAYPAMPQPWAQLCRRCFRGSAVLAAADKLRTELGY